MDHVWAIYTPPPECQCWRDTLCSHGLTWQEPDGMEEPCAHARSYHPIFVSLADAIRYLFGVVGPEQIACLLKERGLPDSPHPRVTENVWVMRPQSAPLIDDHDSNSPGRPLAVISREPVYGRSTPRNDVKRQRQIANEYRET